MRNTNRLRNALVVIIMMLGAASIVLPVVAVNSREAVERTTRHDIAWTAENGRMELAGLTRNVLAFAVGHASEDHDTAILYHQILSARVRTWNAGIFRVFLNAVPDRKVRVDTFARMLAEIEAPVAQLDDDAARALVLDRLDKMAAIADRIAGSALSESNEEMTTNQQRLRTLQWVQQALIGALLLCGFLLIALLHIQNRLLRRAHAAVHAAASEYEYLAAHDSLTGLPNRATFQAAYVAATCAFHDRAGATGQGLAVALIDLDGFKPINDTLGHLAGDSLLVAIAGRLRAAVADIPGSHSARFGGDEFVVMFADVASVDEAVASAERLLQALRAPHEIGGHQMMVDASVGLAVAMDPREDSGDLLMRADLALNGSKGAGKGRVVLYEPGIAEDIARRRALEADLARAIACGEFEPYYQPVTDMATGAIVAVEALVRWNHPTRGLVSPAEFVLVAESTGHIVEIGRIMLEKACRDAVRFPRPIQVAVNLSTVQLMRVDVAAMVADVLSSSGLAPGRLKLEITESVMMCDEARSREMIRRVHALGVDVSLDDFGTGYSSLSYLRGFGFDELKIDRSFIVALDQDPDNLAIVQTIVQLGQKLGLRVVAEGIETQAQASLIMACGCARGQGYLYGRPVSLDRLLTQLDDSFRKDWLAA